MMNFTNIASSQMKINKNIQRLNYNIKEIEKQYQLIQDYNDNI